MSEWKTVPNVPGANIECRFCGLITAADIEKKLDWHTTTGKHIKLVAKLIEEDIDE